MTLKAEFRKAYEVTLQDGLDLEQVYEDQDPGFFIQSGIKRGVAVVASVGGELLTDLVFPPASNLAFCSS